MPQLDVVENFADDTILTQAQLHAAFLSIENFVNLTKLDAENIQSGAIDTSLIAQESITTEKIAPSSILLSKLANEVIQRLNPAGSIHAYGGDTIPNGYLLCDGSPVSRTTFPALFGSIGVKHGNGDGSTTFNLPDYRGRFLRGKDFGTGRDLDAAGRTAMASGGVTGDNVGSVQADDNKSHNHPINIIDPAHSHAQSPIPSRGLAAGGSNVTGGGGGEALPIIGIVANVTGITANSDLVGTESRPINANVNWMIKT